MPNSTVSRKILTMDIGLIALSSDLAIEKDLASVLPADLNLKTTRIDYGEAITAESLKELLPKLREGAQDLPSCETIGFACTSGSVAIGFSSIQKAIREAQPKAACLTPMSAGLEVFRDLGIKKIAFLTPYPNAVSEMVKNFFYENDLEVSHHKNLNLHYDKKIYEVSPERITREALKTIDDSADCLFISCTTFRALEAIQMIENQSQIPVVTSNQALAYSYLKRAKIHNPIYGYGRLLEG